MIEPDELIMCTHCMENFEYRYIEDPSKHKCAKDYEEEIAERREARNK